MFGWFKKRRKRIKLEDFDVTDWRSVGSTTPTEWKPIPPATPIEMDYLPAKLLTENDLVELAKVIDKSITAMELHSKSLDSLWAQIDKVNEQAVEIKTTFDRLFTKQAACDHKDFVVQQWATQNGSFAHVTCPCGLDLQREWAPPSK